MKVKDGVIAGIAVLSATASEANLTAAAALKFGLKTILDYGDLIISPGLIDTHVHFNEPGREHWEGEILLSISSLHRTTIHERTLMYLSYNQQLLACFSEERFADCPG